MKTNLNNLLVIEDNPYIGQKIVNAAKKINGIKNIYLSESLKEAFSFLNKSNFEIITLDLSLPDGNGIEVLKWLKEKKTDKKVFVFSTSTELKQMCLKYGALAFFDKANDFDDLIENIKYA
ncbi:MAG: response regulator [Polaribacter sp.]|uniref:response regulator n=1 Tax=Polaribacter sp. TaxID=1920175 RepID=UPI0032659351